MSQLQDVMAPIAALLSRAGLSASVESIEPCILGGNNRTYAIATTAGRFAAKQYFRHAGDNRDRLATEFAFLTYAEQVAPGFAPKPHAIDIDAGLALYEFIDGRPVSPGGVAREEMAQASAFFQTINSSAARAGATALPLASEACFSIRKHLDLIEQRLRLLRQIPVHAQVDQAAVDLVAELSLRWNNLAEQVLTKTSSFGWNPAAELEPDQRCVSPSDFGFHNALRQSDGRLRFLDFEYAGWDDPAKMTGDFFAQLAVPVPCEHFEFFARASLSPLANPEELFRRARLLRPVYQIKWCCIALNVFLPVHLARRKFSHPDLDEVALKQAQLKKAATLFQTIELSNHGLH